MFKKLFGKKVYSGNQSKKSFLSKLLTKFLSWLKKTKKNSRVESSSNIPQGSFNNMPSPEAAKFDVAMPTPQNEKFCQTATYTLPHKYNSDKLALLSRDPWWLFSYWDISHEKINSVVSKLKDDDNNGLHWVLRVYDVTGVKANDPFHSNSFYDIDINFDAGSWYINVNRPERDWIIDIGFKNYAGKFFLVLRSNLIKTPCFGVSSVTDEEWVIPDDVYMRLFMGGAYNIGLSSAQMRKKIEQDYKNQLSSHISSWVTSGGVIPSQKEKDDFFLETWTEVIVYGRTHADAHVTLSGKKIQLRPDGTFSVRYALPEGKYKYEIEATSKNGKHKRREVPAVKRYKKK